MNSSNLTIRERERRRQLDNLNAAEKALRANLHLHGLDETARQHIERALNHVREGYVAVNEPGRAHSVQELVETLNKVEGFIEKLAANQSRAGAISQTIG